MRRNFFIFVALFIVLLLALRVLLMPVVVGKDFYYILLPGTTAQTLAKNLHDKAHLRFPIVLRMLVKLRFAEKRLQSGEYIFPVDSTVWQILNQVINGQVVQHAFTIIDGWTIHQVLATLKRAPALQHELPSSSVQKIAETLNLPHSSPEGWLYPDTYYYTYGETDRSVLRRAAQRMQTYLQSAWAGRAQHLPYKNTYQVLIVASMVEKETAIDAERPLIAAVILKRLDKWMHLQIDSAVIYGLGTKFKGRLTKQDLRSNTRYNTYLHYGLPPTPICMPGVSSIEAALHPAQTDALYFVARGDGTHVFSQNLRKHNLAVEKYQK